MKLKNRFINFFSYSANTSFKDLDIIMLTMLIILETTLKFLLILLEITLTVPLKNHMKLN